MKNVATAPATVAQWKSIFLAALAEEFTSTALEYAMRENFIDEDYEQWWNEEDPTMTDNVEAACDALEELGLPREIQVWEKGNVVFDSKNADMSTVQIPVEDFFNVLEENNDVNMLDSAAIEHADVYLFTNELDYFVLVKGDGHNDDEFHYFDNKGEAEAKFDYLKNESGSM